MLVLAGDAQERPARWCRRGCRAPPSTARRARCATRSPSRDRHDRRALVATPAIRDAAAQESRHSRAAPRRARDRPSAWTTRALHEQPVWDLAGAPLTRPATSTIRSVGALPDGRPRPLAHRTTGSRISRRRSIRKSLARRWWRQQRRERVVAQLGGGWVGGPRGRRASGPRPRWFPSWPISSLTERSSDSRIAPTSLASSLMSDRHDRSGRRPAGRARRCDGSSRRCDGSSSSMRWFVSSMRWFVASSACSALLASWSGSST